MWRHEMGSDVTWEDVNKFDVSMDQGICVTEIYEVIMH